MEGWFVCALRARLLNVGSHEGNHRPVVKVRRDFGAARSDDRQTLRVLARVSGCIRREIFYLLLHNSVNRVTS